MTTTPGPVRRAVDRGDRLAAVEAALAKVADTIDRTTSARDLSALVRRFTDLVDARERLTAPRGDNALTRARARHRERRG